MIPEGYHESIGLSCSLPDSSPVGRREIVDNVLVLQLQIRLAKPEDLENVVGVWERSRWDAQPWLEERMNYSHESNLRQFRDVVARECDIWLATEEDKIVGLLAIADEQIDQLYVEPECQGRGIGSALLDHAKALVPAGLWLFTHQANERARAFYERRGFRAVKLGVSPPPESEPDVKYAWSSRENARDPRQHHRSP